MYGTNLNMFSAYNNNHDLSSATRIQSYCSIETTEGLDDMTTDDFEVAMDDEVAILQNVQNVDVIELSSGDDEVVAASQAPARRRIGPAAAAQAPARHIAAKRGPNIVRGLGDDTYDDFCMFANDVDLDKFQVHFLREKVNKVHGPITRPFYVCTMKKSNIKAKTNPKMNFTKEYTNAYLKEYISKTGRYVLVFDQNGHQVADVKMKLGKGRDGRAMITSHWKDVVANLGMKAGQVYMFWFRRSITPLRENTLKLIVERVY